MVEASAAIQNWEMGSLTLKDHKVCLGLILKAILLQIVMVQRLLILAYGKCVGCMC